MTQLPLAFEPELTSEQRAVWNVIRRRHGRAAAIPMPDVAKAVYDDHSATRRVQTAIKELIELGMPIGSASSKPNGYWVLATAEEYDDADDNLKHRIIALAQRRRNLKKHRPPLAGQQNLNHGNTEGRNERQ